MDGYSYGKAMSDGIKTAVAVALGAGVLVGVGLALAIKRFVFGG